MNAIEGDAGDLGSNRVDDQIGSNRCQAADGVIGAVGGLCGDGVATVGECNAGSNAPGVVAVRCGLSQDNRSARSRGRSVEHHLGARLTGGAGKCGLGDVSHIVAIRASRVAGRIEFARDSEWPVSDRGAVAEVKCCTAEFGDINEDLIDTGLWAWQSSSGGACGQRVSVGVTPLDTVQDGADSWASNKVTSRLR